MSIAHSFNGTCVPVYYPCQTGSRYLDPCDCSRYFLCENQYSIRRVSCAPGTAFDHTSSSAFCRAENDIIIGGICDDRDPWDRCEDYLQSSALGLSVDDIEQRCKDGGHYTTPVLPPKKEADTDGGAIAGAIIAILIIIAIVVAVAFYVRRKGNPLKHLKETRFWRAVVERTAWAETPRSRGESPRYAGYPKPAEDEETYTEIDDAAMYKDPGSRKASSAGRGRMASHSNETYQGEEDGGAAYDNPALCPDTPPLDSARHPAPPPYTEADGEPGMWTEMEGRQGVPLSARSGRLGAAKPLTARSEPPVGEDGYLEPFSQSARRQSEPVNQSTGWRSEYESAIRRSSEQQPVYYELEAEAEAEHSC